MHDPENPRRNAFLALGAAGVLVLVASLYLFHVLFQAFVHGRAAIGKRSAHWEYFFAQDPLPALFVLLINLALVAAILLTARECYGEYRYHLEGK